MSAERLDQSQRRTNPTEEDRVWNQYMAKRRDWRELVTLLKHGDIQPKFQHRVLQILLAPDISRLSFAANLDRGLGTYVGFRNHWTESITDEQAIFVADLLPGYITQAQQTVRGDKHNYGAREALFNYNDLIPRLLGKLPPEQAERLFASFSINDPLSCWNMDTASGYNPLQILYYDRTVDESWKRRAASQIHEVIQREQSGEATPRVEHESAARNYGQALGMMLYGDNGLPISREFYQDEVAFMLEVETGRPIVDSWHIGRVLDLLDDSELRHSFARRQVLPGDPDYFDSFKVKDEPRAETARRIIGEFPEDTELKTYLEQQLQKWQVRSEQDAQQREQAARIEQDVLQRMRKPSSV